MQNLGGSEVGIRNLLVNFRGWLLLSFLNMIVDEDHVTNRGWLDIWCVVGWSMPWLRRKGDQKVTEESEQS